MATVQNHTNEDMDINAILIMKDANGVLESTKIEGLFVPKESTVTFVSSYTLPHVTANKKFEIIFLHNTIDLVPIGCTDLIVLHGNPME